MISRAELDYDLPEDLIAQQPIEPRDAARLLVMRRERDRLDELRFAQLADALAPGDLLVVNDTRVRRAKLRGRKASGGRAEALLLEPQPDGSWTAFVRCGGRQRRGLELAFGEVTAKIADVLEDGVCRLALDVPDGAPLEHWLERHGEPPLPPYIRRPRRRPADLVDYQSVFARELGAVAAPTASLHFTPELVARVSIARVTLHVGPGTFRPVRAQYVADHVIGPERFEVPEATAAAIAATRARGARVIAVGTTVVRALETTVGRAGGGATDLLITPGYRFRAVDELITNFHLPGSSLLALVMAFGGIEAVRAAYAHAVRERFRFYSYGDAMWIR